MRLLKQLELNGFKSFASKTVFDFSGGITAIVGPNGSGKSNIIDAIRWLLGEREARNLRGGKSEDLIFAGTPKRPRLGQAQASLRFENNNGFFPVDFPEITIMREVRRDGTNRYFLNKSEIRLKDLIDFFARARLGAKGLVVITQGNSDVFIQANPVGRREMIEEILGLREYQIKKAEAEKRLKSTQVNLDKARALAEEILPHLRSLKRQTHRWEKRETLREELRDLENRFFGGEYAELKAEMARVETALREHAGLLAGLRKEKEKAEENLRKIEAGEPRERKELQVIRDKIRDLLDRRSALEKDIGRLEAQLEMEKRGAVFTSVPAGAAAPAAAAELAKILNLLEEIKVKLELALDEPEEMESAVNQVLEKIDEVLREAALRESEKSRPLPRQNLSYEVSDEFRKIKKDLESLEKEISELRAREKDLEKSQEQFYALFKKALAAVGEAKEKLEHWESREQQLIFDKERLEFRLAEWEKRVRQAERQPEEFYNLPGAGDQVASLAPGGREAMEKRIFRLRAELASLGEIDEALVKEARATEERYEFLKRESEDLEKARADLKKLIAELKEKIKIEFTQALAKINAEFDKFFAVMFGGGHAKLKMVKRKVQGTEPGETTSEPGPGEATTPILSLDKIDKEESDEEEGLDIDVKLPRKRITSLEMLSGGERSLVGIAALFAIISVSSPPFLVLDEVDAALDERNSRRFAEMLKEFSKETQFIIVTHNRATMEAADVLYGITMNDDGTSKVVSLKLET
jgi:chromosome segregation protein